MNEAPHIDFASGWYLNCKRQRKHGAKICRECPFRDTIEEQETAPMMALVRNAKGGKP